MTVYPFLFLLYDLLLPLYNGDWGCEPECPVTHGQEVEVGHYKQSPLCTNVLHLRICFHWSPSARLTASPPHPFSHSPPTSLLHFLPPPFPLLPSSVCFCSLDSLSVPTSTLSLSNYSPSLSLLCLLDCKREARERKAREGKKNIMLTSN